jgi:hypothetical protein
MQSPDQLFQRLLKELRPTLAKEGFRRKSQNFVAESLENWGIINLQKSLYSATEQKSFTINLAIAAKRILRFHGEPTAQPPIYYASHWNIRIGDLIPGNLDRWWALSDEQSYGVIAHEVTKYIVELAIPIIRNHLSEEGLLQLWESRSPGRFEFPNLKYKSILLAERGEFEKLPAIFERIEEICRGGAAEAAANEHIGLMKRYYLQIQ